MLNEQILRVRGTMPGVSKSTELVLTRKRSYIEAVSTVQQDEESFKLDEMEEFPQNVLEESIKAHVLNTSTHYATAQAPRGRRGKCSRRNPAYRDWSEYSSPLDSVRCKTFTTVSGC